MSVTKSCVQVNGVLVNTNVRVKRLKRVTGRSSTMRIATHAKKKAAPSVSGCTGTESRVDKVDKSFALALLLRFYRFTNGVKNVRDLLPSSINDSISSFELTNIFERFST